MKHIFQEGRDSNSPTLLLLHGTGGTEQDLLKIGERISPHSSLLSVRGNVLENGMPRFFRRLAEGVFDEEDLIKRTKELHEFLDDSASDYRFDRNHIVAVGYSNGANIAASLLFHYENSLEGAVLFHPMVPRRGIKLPNLSNTNVFIGAEKNAPLCPPQETEDLKQLLKEAGANVQTHWENHGHQLTFGEVDQAAKWFNQTFPQKKMI